MPLHRLFVGNIPGGTSEQELKNEFSSYGPVRGIDLKSKANPLTGSDDTFAFVNIEVDERTLRQLLDEFRREKYKGVYLNVSRAKESFLDRLKREREEAEAAKEKSGLLNPYKKEEQEKAVVVKEALPALPTIAKEVESSSEESSEESEEDEKPEPVRSVVGRQTQQQQQGEEDQLVRKWNQETYIEHGKLKIAFTSGEVKQVIDKSKNRRQPEKELADKARVADEKRKQGLTKLQSAYEQQKLAIQAALAGGDGQKRNKIVFADDDDEVEEGGKRKKVKLFDDQEEEDDFKGNFTVRKQLAENSEKGQRLYEMQTQFHGDSRFKLDERFLADDDSAAGRRKRKALEKEKATLDAAGQKPNNGERRKQLEILSKVTGRDIPDGARTVPDQKSMQRFDPSAQKGKEPARVEKKKALTEEEIIAAKRAERPEETFAVSEEKFFQVAQDLTQVIGQSSGGFSLLSMFGSAARADEDDEEVEEEQEKSLGKPAYSDARFKYESSDSEDEVEEQKPESPVQEVPQEPAATKKKDRKPGYYSKQGIWKENFFFLPDDVRLEEGRKFFLEFATEPAANDSRKEQARDIRKIFKKRRMRETKNVNQMRARRGLKLMKVLLYGTTRPRPEPTIQSRAKFLTFGSDRTGRSWWPMSPRYADSMQQQQQQCPLPGQPQWSSIRTSPSSSENASKNAASGRCESEVRMDHSYQLRVDQLHNRNYSRWPLQFKPNPASSQQLQTDLKKTRAGRQHWHRGGCAWKTFLVNSATTRTSYLTL